jgi:hypothetical protein
VALTARAGAQNEWVAALFAVEIDGHKLNCSNCVSFCGEN